VRGHLLFRFVAELCRVDRPGTGSADPDGVGPLTGGFDPDFKESVVIDPADDSIGERVRAEFPPVRVPCQVETNAWEELAMQGAGDAPRSDLVLVFHFRDLERLDLVDPTTGAARIGPGDRLQALFDVAGELVQAVRTPPGLYVTEARPAGFGLFMPRPRRNLLLVSFAPRGTAAPRGVFP